MARLGAGSDRRPCGRRFVERVDAGLQTSSWKAYGVCEAICSSAGGEWEILAWYCSMMSSPNGWRGRKPLADRIMPNRVEQHVVEHGELLAHHPAHRQQRLDDRRQAPKSLTRCRIRAS
jgi:hypothetical protein